MNSAHTLEEALGEMRFEVLEGRFALVGFPAPPAAADWELVTGAEAAQVVREGGETTLLVPEVELGALLERHPEAAVERDQVWIRFRAPMAWDLVGFLALVTGRLASAGIPLGAVCGFSRDHLFVAGDRLDEVRAVLCELFPEVR